MKTYKVNRGFMAYQFDGKPIYSVGIESNAIKKAGDYHCIVGKSEAEFNISYDDCLALVTKYGEDKAIRTIRGKSVFIVPLSEVKK
jgi:hypothetical protein